MLYRLLQATIVLGGFAVFMVVGFLVKRSTGSSLGFLMSGMIYGFLFDVFRKRLPKRLFFGKEGIDGT